MSNRQKMFYGLWAYLTLVAYFFGVLFSGNRDPRLMVSALLAVGVAQGVVLYLLILIKRTDV